MIFVVAIDFVHLRATQPWVDFYGFDCCFCGVHNYAVAQQYKIECEPVLKNKIKRLKKKEHARSRPISEAKQGRAWLVLGWETAWEYQVL